MNTALLAEYLALASTLRADSPGPDFRRANQLAYQLAMELDADLWRIVLRGIASGTVNDIWQAIFAAREISNARGKLTVADAVLHAPRVGAVMPHNGEPKVLHS